MSDLQKFCKNLRYACDILDVNQVDLAEAADVDETYVSRILNGQVPQVSMKICSKLANGIEIPLRDLLDEPGKFILAMRQAEQVA